MIRHRKKIAFGIIICLLVVFAFLCGENLLSETEQAGKKNLTGEEKIAVAQEMYEEQQKDENVSQIQSDDEIADTLIITESDPIVENAEPVVEGRMTCSLYVRCDTLVDNLQNLDESKISIIPKDGIIFAGENVEVYEGESVFNVLVREMKKNKIHLEFTKTPGYNSAYIEGIGNLYEFDCGELSGWMYRVNGQTPGCGCSSYTVKNKDVIEFLYSCNLGVDIGAYKDLTGE